MIVNSVLLITGETGTGKTSLITTAADWLWRKYRKRLRLYTADGGGFGSFMESRIKLGIVELFRIRSRFSTGAEGLLEETFLRCSQGWWPEQINAETGETLPGARLLSPVEATYRMFCAAGHLLRTVPTQAALGPTACSQCGKLVTLETARVEQETQIAAHMEDIGGVAFEGLTSWSNCQIISLADRRARLELHGEKSNIGRFQSGDLQLDGNNRADYGFAQVQAERWLLNSTAIPGLLIPPTWTGLETRVDEGMALPFYGPAIAGVARTGQVPQWVGSYLGTARVLNAETGRPEYRLYLTERRGQDSFPHVYKTRAEPGVMPDYLSDGAGEPFSGFNLGVFLELLENAETKSTERARVMHPDAPGLRPPRPKPEPAAAPPQVRPSAPVVVAATPTTRPRPPARPPVGSPLPVGRKP